MVPIRRLFDQEWRVKVFNNYPKILRMTKDLGLLKFVRLCMKFFKLVVWVLRDAPFVLRALYGTNVDCRLNGPAALR